MIGSQLRNAAGKKIWQNLHKNLHLIICDCEGCELQLLDPEQIESLKSCDILVEFHDLENEMDTEQVLRTRFEETHDIKIQNFSGRKSSNFPRIDFLSESEKKFAVDENRSRGLKWALFTAKN